MVKSWALSVVVSATTCFLIGGPLTNLFQSTNHVAQAEEGVASYPDDEPIDLVESRVSGYELLKTIDFADQSTSLDGWVEAHNVKLSRDEKSMRVTMTDDDPYFVSPKLEGFPSGKIVVKLRLRHKTNPKTKLYFASQGENFAEERSTQLSLAIDDEAHDYAFLLDASNPIQRVRFDVGDRAGSAEIERLDFYRVLTEPVKFGVMTADNGVIHYELLNMSGEKSIIVHTDHYGFDVRKVYPGANTEIVGSAAIDSYYPQKRPFEEMEVVGKPFESETVFNRRFFAFNEKACGPAPGQYQEGEAPTIRNGSLAIRFAKDATGAEIFRDGKLVAVFAPLFYEEENGGEIIPQKTDLLQDLQKSPEEFKKSPPTTRLTPILRSLSEDGKEIEFAVCDAPIDKVRKALNELSDKSVEHDPFGLIPPREVGLNRDETLAANVGFIRFSLLDDDVVAFEFDAPRRIHAPVLRIPGTMKQATLPGVEYLEEGEHSSSTADIETAEHVRFAPPVHWVAQRYAAITTDRASLTLLYNDPKAQPVFAVPDFIDGDAKSSRMNVCAKSLEGKIRVADPEPLEDAILWATRQIGLPEPPIPAKKGREAEEFILQGLTQSVLKTPDGWVHALLSADPPYTFKPSYGCDYVSTIWEITGKLPDVPRLDYGGSHITNYAALLLMGHGKKLIANLDGARRNAIESMRDDGSYRYAGKYLKGSRVDFASGYSGNYLYRLGENWRLTGSQDALDALVKGLEFMNQERTPRGAQVWEISLHTPDIMGASRCAMANLFAYKATGDQKYLDAARRWAITGLPFVYLWEDASLKPFPEDARFYRDGDYQPMMKYATTAVFGATSWVAPNWMGRPVQWCGLDYAHALIMLAPYDDTLDWKKIAEGIVASAECQLCLRDDVVGLLPDSFQVETQERFPYYINPCVVHMLRRLLDGKHTNVDVADVDGRRVVAPFPLEVEGSALRVNAVKGATYQIMIDGRELRTIESQGVDEIAF